MSTFKKIIKNTTNSDIDIIETGRRIPALGQIEIDPIRYLYWATPETITEITPLINSGDLIVNDGIQDLIVANGISLDRAIDFLKYSDSAFSTRFLSDPERANGFASKNVQEAIEELKNNPGNPIGGRTFAVPFFNNGNTANKWLFHIPTSEATDQLPYISAWNVEIFGILFSNKNTAINCDVEFYVNGTNNPAKVYTLEVRGYENRWETTSTSFFNMNVGDRLSVFIRKVGNNTPSSVEVDLNLRITSLTGSSGGNNP